MSTQVQEGEEGVIYMRGRVAEVLLGAGFFGIMATLLLGFHWAPSVSDKCL